MRNNDLNREWTLINANFSYPLDSKDKFLHPRYRHKPVSLRFAPIRVTSRPFAVLFNLLRIHCPHSNLLHLDGNAFFLFKLDAFDALEGVFCLFKITALKGFELRGVRDNLTHLDI